MTKKIQFPALTILAVQLIIAGVAHANISAKLSPSAKQDVKNFPYRSAALKIHNDTSQEFSAVRIQNQHGGPTFIFPAVILPNEKSTLTVSLPAVSLTQTYDIKLQASDKPDSPALETLTAQINWPTDMLTRNEFINPAIYKAHGQALPSWSIKLKRVLFITTAAGVLVLIAILLIPQPSLRTALLIPAVLGLTFLLGSMLSKKAPILNIQKQGNFQIITSLRTCDIAWGKLPKDAENKWEFIGHELPVPIYQADWQMREDKIIIYPSQFTTLQISPDEVRIFRNVGYADTLSNDDVGL